MKKAPDLRAPFTGIVLATLMVAGCGDDGDACEGAACGTGGAGGTGGTGGSGGAGTSVECLPENISGAIPADCGIFVDARVEDVGEGTQVAPYATLDDAVRASNGAPIYVCTSGAQFTEAIQISEAMDLFGGFDCDTWEATGDKVEWTAEPDEIPLRILGTATVVRIEGFAIRAADAIEAGGSSIAMLVSEALVDVRNVELEAGDGAAGEVGLTPPGPAEGGASGDPSTIIPPLGGVKECGPIDVSGGNGGGGGSLSPGYGSPGQDGLPQPFSNGGQDGLGGNGEDAVDECADGHNGAPGLPGLPGPGAAGLGTLSIDGYAGPSGQPGQSAGGPGQGGGGGGGLAGNVQNPGSPGGGGGSGGCGGDVGQGGQAGGSSFALVSVDASVSVVDSTLITAAGGAGGDGSPGQEGGDGGNAGVDASPTTCDGGQGGKGGRGGAAGGGLGGHSVAIAFAGEVPSDSGVTFEVGVAGPGGEGGNGGDQNMGGAGDPGRSKDTLNLSE